MTGKPECDDVTLDRILSRMYLPKSEHAAFDRACAEPERVSVMLRWDDVALCDEEYDRETLAWLTTNATKRGDLWEIDCECEWEDGRVSVINVDDDGIRELCEREIQGEHDINRDD